MTGLLTLPDRLLAWVDARIGDVLMPTLARVIFLGVLFLYFWNSAVTKVSDGFFGIFSPSTGAYAQIFPKKAEEVLYDPAMFSAMEKTIIIAGTWAEFIFPVLIVVGLLTRLSALGMIGFVVVQSLTDIFGHGADEKTIGAWFDGPSDAVILDQRAFWVFLLVFLVLRGAGPLSLDALLQRGRSPETAPA
ncbi:DoxX family protein [Actibacterium sp. 188UL27-1]|uniref:DoxX family protein n=1 Tax=Actibacterium sp. 188UL27-1 TaxID=2786961 RepID=UPI0019564E85|nr:DoxX family protein [Actibacterium sp. 188UL27-1]MBM7069442.1 DoxX family protein [Actibacterium sp. 188UL27-1]